MRAAAVVGMLGVWIVGAVGCGGGSGGSSSPPATASEFCQQQEALLIKSWMQCYGGTAADWSAIWFDPAVCSELDTAVANHHLKYDATKARACLDELAKPFSCSGEAAAGPPCLAVVGLVADGDPCEGDYVCRPGSECFPPEGVLDYCPPKICRHVPTAGEKCELLGGAYLCSNSICDGKNCAALAKLGDACGAVGQYCSDGLYCASGDALPTCKRVIEGGPCAGGLECPYYQYCDATSGRCHDRLDVGGDCSADPTSCQTFTACDPTTHRCVEASHLGQLCGNFGGSPWLCDGGACLPDQNEVYHCVIGVDEGGACANDFECWDSNLCTGGKCTAPPPNDGTACTEDTMCTSRFCGATGVCVAPAPNGTDCFQSEQCASRACVAGTCVMPAADGATCTDGPECMSGHCAAGKCAACL